MATDRLIITDDAGLEHVIPSLLDVCPACMGSGFYDHPMIESEDFNCDYCKGFGITLVPDQDLLTVEQRQILYRHQQAMEDIAAIDRCERSILAEYL